MINGSRSDDGCDGDDDGCDGDDYGCDGDDYGCDGTNGCLQLVRYRSELVLLQQLQEQLLRLLFQLLRFDFSSY